jgi:hypothetical protein
MEFTSRPFTASHGKEPRGRGSWAFCPAAKANSGNYLDFTVFSPGNMTLTMAKAWAKQQPALQGTTLVAVLP